MVEWAKFAAVARGKVSKAVDCRPEGNIDVHIQRYLLNGCIDQIGLQVEPLLSEARAERVVRKSETLANATLNCNSSAMFSALGAITGKFNVQSGAIADERAISPRPMSR